MKCLWIAVVIVVAIGTGPVLPAQTPALTFYDLAAMPRYPFGGMQARGAMGQQASMFIAEVPPGVRTTPHHHHQEQFMLGLDGAMNFILAGSFAQPLVPLTAAFAPPNVQHGNVNGEAPAKYIEFQPVLRPDWYPPHPRRPREGTPEALPIPEGLKVRESFAAASSGWRSAAAGARAKMLSGATASVTIWEVPATAEAFDLTAGPAAERFVYVVDGTVTIADGTVRREARREMLVMVAPAARGVRVLPSAKSTTLAVFAAYVR